MQNGKPCASSFWSTTTRRHAKYPIHYRMNATVFHNPPHAQAIENQRKRNTSGLATVVPWLRMGDHLVDRTGKDTYREGFRPNPRLEDVWFHPEADSLRLARMW